MQLTPLDWLVGGLCFCLGWQIVETLSAAVWGVCLGWFSRRDGGNG